MTPPSSSASDNHTASGGAPIGVTGLAVMGANIARNFARHGHTVAVHNRSFGRTQALISDHGSEGNFVATKTIAEFVASLATPRRALIMVQAGAATDAVIEELAAEMEPGDIIIDGGNALYTDTRRREAALRERGIHFVGCGISGGEEGALNGPSIMPGGSRESYTHVGPLLESVAAVVDDTPCCTYIGPDGAGHYVKMVHNGIEYADMQLIGEAYQLLTGVLGYTPAQCAEVFAEWNKGVLESYLIDITADVLAQVDAETGAPLIDVILDATGQKGTGRWTVKSALDLGVPVTGIAEAVFARAVSGSRELREAAHGLPGGELATTLQEALPNIDEATFLADIHAALYASKVVAYAQGFNQLTAGSVEYGWDLKPGDLATIWRGGCIIRAQFLGRIREAYAANPDLPSLLLDPYFSDAVAASTTSWRRVVVAATSVGVAVPGFSSALAYYDSIRADRLPAALLQGLRDYFGAHTYERIDKPGHFHTLWGGDRSEIRTD
ncbi:NADP-dependent phosphogluconate dehydrogenase [Hoyosella rhizosphaerae]|uniref:6-phosphogluconate dehydrogenase, decarboxylating n=1 Tax=Hoyosella rhizosphaerae TaxID=1755582 RepID=A0A916U171_9ACTN|nr:NADP-dependent phosphogluconate dehydrogenase [Hoyosella rhizosphaerae]MBN4927285.1 NADP-dependent phosphogluconate dehydrogenase [Hoyosella rhizosphaerae]GGC52471.1 6-phosphogluconate dehydrogenase, decarboxylating [Hoyosella rhizosphaerae]